MSFAARDLSVLAYANGFTLWHYTTPDVSVDDGAYFNEANDMFRSGDIVITNTDNKSNIKTALYVVASTTDQTVTVQPLIER